MVRPKATARKSAVDKKATLAQELNEQGLDSLSLPDIKVHLKAFGDKAVGSKAALLAKLTQKVNFYLGVEDEVEDEGDDEAEVQEEDEGDEAPEEDEVEEEKPKKVSKVSKAAKAKAAKAKAALAAKAKAKAIAAKAKAALATKKPKGKVVKKPKVVKKAPKKKVAVVEEEAEDEGDGLDDDEGDDLEDLDDDEAVEDDEVEFPTEIKVPNVTFCVEASILARIINQANEVTSDKASFYQHIFDGLKTYKVAATKAKTTKVEAKATKAKPKPKPVEVEEETEVEEPEVEEEVPVETEEEEVPVEEEEEVPVEVEVADEAEEPVVAVMEKPDIRVGYNHELGVYMDTSNSFVWDKATSSAFAKVVNRVSDSGTTSSVVPLQNSDVVKNDNISFWHIIQGRAPTVLPSKKEVDDLVKANKKPVTKVPPKAAPKVESKVPPPKPPTRVGGTEVPKATTPKATTPKPVVPKPEVIIEEVVEEPAEEENEGGDDGDVVDEVEAEIIDLTSGGIEISEAIFTAFVVAQYSDGVNRADFMSVSKKSGLPPSVCEQIMLQYRALSDQFPHALTNAVVKKVPPKPTGLGSKAQLAAPSQRRLLKSKQ